MHYGLPVPATGELAYGSFQRSVELFRLFLREQSEPARFYTALARDSVRMVQRYSQTAGARVLDVGGGPGYFRAAFESAGARYVAVDPDVGELSAAGSPGPNTVLGSGMALPLRDDAVDIAFSSNVLEHVPDPWRMADEMVRVTRPGGTVVISYTLWWGPWGGHETAPWHYLGGRRAAQRYRRRYGAPPKNEFGTSLFPLTAADGIRWARRCDRATVVAVEPRYLPSWARGLVRVPGLREVATWNLLLVLRAT
jgi:SAM-dependent methyltransferase